MGVRKKNTGFTIIEVVLFLGITGLLILALMVGVGVSVRRHRYDDSVAAFVDFLKEQFGKVQNVQNTVATDHPVPGCTGGGTGQSSCVIYGRYIFMDSEGDGSSGLIRTYLAVGPEVQNINDMFNNVYAVGGETVELPWGAVARYVFPSGSGSRLHILIYRSPVTGMISTRIVRNSTGMTAEGSAFKIPVASGTVDRVDFCVVSPDSYAGQRQVRLVSGASSAAGVTLKSGDDSKECDA